MRKTKRLLSSLLEMKNSSFEKMGVVEKRIDIKGTLDFTFDANWN